MEELLRQLKISAEVVDIQTNKSMTKYYLKLEPGEKVAKIERSATEIALGMKSYSLPIIKTITEMGLVSLELLTSIPQDIFFSNLVPDLKESTKNLPVILGQAHTGENIIFDITNGPHLLIAGTTGSGKSVMLHSIICSLLYNEKTKLILVDPKNVEFESYKNIKQLIYPILNDVDETQEVLSDLVGEMEYRFKLMRSARVNTIQKYNEKRFKYMPYIVLVIDEFSDMILMSKKDFQLQLNRLAQKSRACGIHIILATQRPSAEIITGTIKANFPARISCKTTSAINSRIILEDSGAEKLLGNGDAIINSSTYDFVRFQGAFINQEQINNICKNNNRNKFFKVINYIKSL